MQGTSGGSGFLKGVPRSVILMVIALSVNNLALSYLIIYISAYLPEIGVSAPTVGLLLGVEGLAMAIMAIPFGMLSDRRGRKRLLVLGSLGPVPMFFAFALTTDTAVMVAASALGGLFEGIYLATVNALIADQTTLKNRNTAFALSFIFGGMGGALGTALPFFIPGLSQLIGVEAAALHTDLLFLFGFVSLLIPVALYAILRGVRETIRSAGVSWRGKGIRTLLKFSGINSIIGLGAGFIMPLIPTWLFFKFAVPDTYSGMITSPAISAARRAIVSSSPSSPSISGLRRRGGRRP